MTKIFDRPNCVKKIEIFQIENVAHCRAGVRCRPSQAVIWQLHQL